MSSAHVSRVIACLETAAALPGGALSPEIIESWRRCLREYGLEPARVDQVQVLTPAELKDFRDPVEDVVALAQPELDRLFRLVGDDYIVIFADTQGVAVDFRVSASLETEGRRTGIYLGSIWNERAQGTNGVGTCLRIGRPVSVVQDEHFALRNTSLTCTAVPVRNPRGEIVAILDTGTPRASDHTRERLLLEIMCASAQRIERRLFRRAFADTLIVRLSADPEFIDGSQEALIAVDGGGRVIGLDQPARELLAPQPADGLLGRPVSAVLGIEEADLLATAGGRPADLGALAARCGRLYAKAVLPAPRPRSAPGPRPRPAGEPGASRLLDLADLAGADARMGNAVHLGRKLVDSGLPILLTGETGTGKGAFAEALHRASRRAGRPFVPVNCAAIPEGLIEGELFGYRPGAFTGAARGGSRGKILEADGGTLFLDEIGDMPLEAQTRLLRVLSENEIAPLGAARPVHVDIAVIAATHQPLEALVATGRFREDLFHRLTGAVLTLPPLRERSDRAALIASAFDAEAAQRGRRVRLSPEAALLLERYPWPGNIRELLHVARYAVAISEGETITLGCLPDRLFGSGGQPAGNADSVRAHVLRITLERCKWNVSMAARLLGVSRSTLHRQIREHALQRP
ncbi:MAG: sigma-54-dependent Fis family transcriptional regulator [Rhodospirillaceae bacterium]|nr:sigma-54-dependent Fis family transcriptional regulator [Rhodospirillaceae bacterium]